MKAAAPQEKFRNKFKVYREHLLRFAGYIPLTPAGLCLAIGLGWGVYVRGLSELDLVALAAGTGLLVVLSIAIVAVLLGTWFTRRSLRAYQRPGVLELISGKRVPSGFRPKSRWYVPFVRLDWTVSDFNADVLIESHKGTLREMISCGRRGLKDGLTRRFTVSDTLGLSSISWQELSPGRVRVLPHQGCLDQPSILLSLVSGEDISDPRGKAEGDRVDMRQYQKGDPMKFILWKVYSRSGKVMVRVPERALAARPRACCYLMSGTGDEASAALARVLIELEMLGAEWRFGADGRKGFASQMPDALDLIALSGNVDETSTAGLSYFLQQAESDGYGFCLVLAPPASKKLAGEVFHCLQRSKLRHDIWIGLDISKTSSVGWLKHLSVFEAAPLSGAAVHKMWGGQATLVERESGRVLLRTGSREL